MKEKLKQFWVKQKSPIKLIIGGLLIAVGVPAWMASPATSITYSGLCAAVEADCE